MNMRVSYAFNTSRTKRVIYAFSINGILKTSKKTFLVVFYAIVLAYWYEDGAKLEIISDTCKSMFIFFCFDIMLRNPLFRFLFVF